VQQRLHRLADQSTALGSVGHDHDLHLLPPSWRPLSRLGLSAPSTVEDVGPVRGVPLSEKVAQPNSLDLGSLTTESRRPGNADLDLQPTSRLVELFLGGELAGLEALQHVGPQLERAVDAIAERFARGGRIVYAGAGTAGRLGWLDAVECVPTFGLAPDRVIALLAGGPAALADPREGGEDDTSAGAGDVIRAGVSAADALVGIAASGRTPYTVAALEAARAAGALTVAIANNAGSPLAAAADIAIEAVVGPEIITGSTRLRAGTAQKVLLNALSTLVMVRTGHTYGDLMVDVQATNEKLRDRAVRVLCEATGVSAERARELLADAGDELKTAIVMTAGLDAAAARAALEAHEGSVRAALGAVQR
jgi:N-acetylmuramic acid 6-phosphate etherase